MQLHAGRTIATNKQSPEEAWGAERAFRPLRAGPSHAGRPMRMNTEIQRGLGSRECEDRASLALSSRLLAALRR